MVGKNEVNRAMLAKKNVIIIKKCLFYTKLSWTSKKLVSILETSMPVIDNDEKTMLKKIYCIKHQNRFF